MTKSERSRIAERLRRELDEAYAYGLKKVADDECSGNPNDYELGWLRGGLKGIIVDLEVGGPL